MGSKAGVGRQEAARANYGGDKGEEEKNNNIPTIFQQYSIIHQI
jgi:hypothetical protein